MHNSLSNLQFEQSKLADEKKRYQQIREGFDAKLLSMSEGATASGRDEVRRTLENIKPKQAKALLLEMLDKKEIDEVVTILSPMTDAKRAKIFAEFKSEDELEKLSEVLGASAKDRLRPRRRKLRADNWGNCRQLNAERYFHGDYRYQPIHGPVALRGGPARNRRRKRA